MQFSVKWAAAAAAYVGMAFGAWQMLSQMGDARLGLGLVMGLGIGMFFGGAIGLPLSAVNLFAGLAARWLGRAQPFAVQFGLFALFSSTAYFALLRSFDRSMPGMGLLRADAAVWHSGFVIITLLTAFALMVVTPDAAD